jgi:iron-sulfur cluster assembly protein
MAISLTNSAADRVRTYLEKRGSGVGLRLGVTETGCSGYSYVINYADEINDSDLVFEDKGITVVVQPDALALIDGTEVDFVKNGLNEAFSFRNPNISGECGCGESFNV